VRLVVEFPSHFLASRRCSAPCHLASTRVESACTKAFSGSQLQKAIRRSLPSQAWACLIEIVDFWIFLHLWHHSWLSSSCRWLLSCTGNVADTSLPLLRRTLNKYSHVNYLITIMKSSYWGGWGRRTVEARSWRSAWTTEWDSVS
jgi:hypothetical protein